MRLRLEELSPGNRCIAVEHAGTWVPLAGLLAGAETVSEELRACTSDMVTFLSHGSTLSDEVRRLLDSTPPQARAERTPAKVLLPFQPLSYRDFMLYEAHAIAAARGYARRFLPRLWPFLRTYERLLRRPHPKLRPKPLWYEHPIYYMGNHLSIYSDGDTVPWPAYCSALDYELELGIIVCKPLLNATEAEAVEAVGGFVVFNDFSARDCQLAEMNSGFGPVKAKNFANSIGPVVAEVGDIMPRKDRLAVRVEINGEAVAEGTTAGMRYSIGEMLAYASRGERVFPGEFVATGTIPGCCALENGHWLQPNDLVTLSIDGIGSLTNRIGRPE